jgi:hypothetical protein
VGALQLAGKDLELLERPLVIGLSPRPPQPALDEISVALGSVTRSV